ncbi:hypothetical protein OG585_53810 (plasmid) [Streptomyces sp. NBC_01340]|nr:hypothetical protein [Streptomyces sp. NBC_01728]WSI45620.1 hypothetical protein OG585_53810 [Streptomyces sp. NBC_01340]
MNGDVRTNIPRFTAENRVVNQVLVEHITTLAQAKSTTRTRLAARAASVIIPIPGTRHIARIEEDSGATQLPLSADEMADLDELTGRIGAQGD